MALTIASAGAAKPAPAEDRWTFFVTYAVAILVLLPVAVLAQVLTLPWRQWLPGAEGEKSLIGGVKAAVYTFMSLL